MKTDSWVLTERFEDARAGIVLPIRLVSLCSMFGPLPLFLVTGLAPVASPPVVALGNMDADVDCVVACDSMTEARIKGEAHLRFISKCG